MKKQLFSTYAVVIIALFAPSPSFSSGLDAFVLAIQHFDPGHEFGVEYESEEVEFIRQVLWEARKSVPEVAGLHVQVDGTVQSKFGPSMYRSLRVKPYHTWAGRSDEDIKSLKEIGESIGLGCRHEEQVNRIYRSNKYTSKTRLIRWDLGRNCSEKGDRRLCENSEIVEWLCSLGVESVTLREHEYKTSKSAELFLSYKFLVDLEYNAARLNDDPNYSSVFRKFNVVPHHGSVIGDGPSLRVVPTDNLGGFHGVRVEFSTGWGDCPSGCMNRHYWLFEYRVQGERTGKDWPLFGGLIEESGNPLPEHIRSKLRSASFVR